MTQDLPGNHGQPWTTAELDKLRMNHDRGMTVQQLMKEHGRSKGGITSALRKAGIPFNRLRWDPGTHPGDPRRFHLKGRSMFPKENESRQDFCDRMRREEEDRLAALPPLERNLARVESELARRLDRMKNNLFATPDDARIVKELSQALVTLTEAIERKQLPDLLTPSGD